MPPVIAAVGLYVGSVVVTAAFTAGAVILWGNVLINATLIAILSAGAYYGRSKPTRPDIDLGARTVSVPNDLPPRRVIYGKAKVAPQVIATAEAGQWSYFIYAICEHDFERVNNVYFNNGKFLNETEINTLNSNAVGTSLDINTWQASDGEDLGDLRKRYGDSSDQVSKVNTRLWLVHKGELGDTMSANSAFQSLNIDTAGMVGVSTSFLVIAFPSPSRIGQIRSAERRAIFSGPPSVTIDVDRGGREIADLPTAHQVTTTNYNAARALYDYVSKYTDYGERVFGIDRIDFASFATAFTACEDDNLEAHGMITLTDAVDGVLTQFEMALNGGWITDVGGILNVRANTAQTPVRTITADHILPDWSIVPQTPRESRYSDFTIEFVNDELEVDTIAYYTQEARDEFGERSQEIQAALVMGADQAYGLAATLAARSFHATQVNATLDATGFLVKPGEVVTLDVPELILDHERNFLVVSAARQPNMTVELGLAEYTPPPTVPTRIAVEADLSWNDGTATLSSLNTQIPRDFINATGRGEPSIFMHDIHWSIECTAGVDGDDANVRGYSSGGDDNRIFGSVGGGASRTIAGGTIPGISGARVFTLAASEEQDNGNYLWKFGWDPDTESTDLTAMPEGTRVRMRRSDDVMFDEPFSVSTVAGDGGTHERFEWSTIQTHRGLADGDTFTVEIYTPDLSGVSNTDTAFTDGSWLTEIVFGARRIAPQQVSIPDYSGRGFIRLDFDGTWLGGPPYVEDLRLALIDEDRTLAGTDGLILDCRISFVLTLPNTYPPQQPRFRFSSAEFNRDLRCFSADIMDANSPQGIQDGDRIRAVFYRSPHPLPVDLLKG